MVLRNPLPESVRRRARGIWERYCVLPRRLRLILPALTLVLVGVIVASSASPAAPEQATAQAAGAAGGQRAAASPSAGTTTSAVTSGTPTRVPFTLGTVTPIPNRGISLTATPPPARIGETVKVSDYRLAVVNVQDPATSVYQLVQPTQGNRFIAVQVQVTNTSTRVAPYSYLHFRLRDTGGNEIRSTASTTVEPNLGTGNLAPNESVTGWVTFMVRSDVTVDMLYFQPPGMIGPRGQVSLR